MTAQGDELTPINVVPHFSRLHEWVALEEGYFRDVSLEPNMLADVMHSVSSHRGDEYGRRPQDLPSSRSRRLPTRPASGVPPVTRAPVWVGSCPTSTVWGATPSS
jgi:hypothetical protein